MESVTHSKHENAFGMKWNNIMKITAPAKIGTLLLLVAFSSFTVSAQQNLFSVNNHQNPLKNFAVAANKESHPFFVDIDGDGDLDCFSGEYSNGHPAKVYYYRNDGTNKNPQFKQINGTGNVLNQVVANVLSIPYFIDIDGDGDKDCFIGEGNTGAIIYYKNIGTSAHPQFKKQSAAFNPLSMVKFFASGIANPSFADVDGDGDFDCLVVDEDGNENYFKNTGSATNPAFIHATAGDDPFSTLAQTDGTYNPSFYDWNHDGLPDLFINTAYYKNVGTAGHPAFVQTSENEPFFQNKSPEQYSFAPLRWVDINSDGNVDVFQGNKNGSFVYQTLSSNPNTENAAAVNPASVRVFPNPTKEEFLVNLPLVPNTETVVRITDVQGKLLSTQVLNSSSFKFGKDLKPGIYFIQVLQNNKTVFSQKLIKG